MSDGESPPSRRPSRTMSDLEPMSAERRQEIDAWIAAPNLGLYLSNASAKRRVSEVLAEGDRLRAVAVEAVAELNASHHLADDGIGCVLCYPGDGCWPCITSLVADELAAALEDVE